MSSTAPISTTRRPAATHWLRPSIRRPGSLRPPSATSTRPSPATSSASRATASLWRGSNSKAGAEQPPQASPRPWGEAFVFGAILTVVNLNNPYVRPKRASHTSLVGCRVRSGRSLSLALQVVRFYKHVSCPVLVLGGASRLGFGFGGKGSRRRRRGGKVGSVFFAFHFSTAFPVFVESSDHVRAIPDGHLAIQMFMDGDRASGQRVAEPGFLDLPAPIRNGDGVVFGHHAFGLHGEDPVQIASSAAPECRARPCRLHRKLLVELSDVPLSQKPVGGFRRGDPRQSEFLRQPALPGAEAAFRTAPCLG